MAKIRSATLEVLNALAWRSELASRPPLQEWLAVYDLQKASQLGSPAMKRLESLGYLEKVPDGKTWTYQPSPEGHRASSHGFDAEARWKRAWNGEWVFLMFDVDAKDWRSRTRLQRWLKDEKFGKLQGSVWITPEFDRNPKPLFHDLDMDVKSFFLFKGRDEWGLLDGPTLEKAWRFPLVREACHHYLHWVEPICAGEVPDLSFAEWQERELALWRLVLELDPFLPETLCPSDYPVRKAWKLRKGLRKALT